VTLTEYFHVGIVVPDLEAAQLRLTELLGVEWGPVLVNEIDVRDGDGVERVVPNKICYSTASPHLELIEEVPGSPWVCNEHSNLHHIGVFSSSLTDESGRFHAAQCPLEWMDGRGAGPPEVWAYHRDPLGVRIEIVNDALRPAMEQFMWRAPEA
jgi:glyoxalase/bleomycin resistance protein/dioxygenase superfamily protein